MDPLVLPAITGVLDLGYNIFRGIQSDKALKALQKQRMPRYMDAAGPLQQNLGMATRQFQQGLSPQAEALARGTSANQMAGVFRAATDLGGGQLGSAIGRLGAFNTNQLGLQLGVQDQMARERGMQQMMGVNQQLASLQQRDIAQDIGIRLEKERGYGLAKQQAIMGGLNAISNFGQAAMYQNIYGNNSTGKVNPTQTSITDLGPGTFANTAALTSQYLQNNPMPRLGGSYLPSPLPLSMKYATPKTKFP